RAVRAVVAVLLVGLPILLVLLLRILLALLLLRILLVLLLRILLLALLLRILLLILLRILLLLLAVVARGRLRNRDLRERNCNSARKGGRHKLHGFSWQLESPPLCRGRCGETRKAHSTTGGGVVRSDPELGFRVA